MYTGIETQPSCATAWVAAIKAVLQAGNDTYNVIIDVKDATTHSDADNDVITLVDRFLKRYDENPIISVANTIFPQSLYDAHGVPDFYNAYLQALDDFDHTTKQWGRYFERMVRPRNHKIDGNYRPLQKLVDKLKE